MKRKVFLASIAFCFALMLGSGQSTALAMVGSASGGSGESGENSQEASESALLPSNVFVPDSMKPIFQELLKRSATFRQQCRQIGEAHQLRITVKLLPSLPNCYRALSTVRKTKSGQVIIVLQMAMLGDYSELIGHEFEHALEQAEGWNLKALASERGGYVYRQGDGTFETERAIRAGRIVGYEFRSFREPRLVAFH